MIQDVLSEGLTFDDVLLEPAASDLVSAMTAAQFGQHGVLYQQIAAQAAEVHEQLVAALRSGGAAYALTEAANAATAG